MNEERMYTCGICGRKALSEADAAQCKAQGEIPLMLPEGTVFEETIIDSRIYHVLESFLDITETHLRKYKMMTVYQHKGMPDPLTSDSSFEVSRDSTRLERGALGIKRNTKRLSPLEIESLPQTRLTAELKHYLEKFKMKPVRS